MFVVRLSTISLMLLAARECGAQDPAPEMIRNWIKSLDSESYAAREDATQNLLRCGPEAFDAMGEALMDSSPEVSWRLIEVLTHLARSDKRTWYARVEKTLIAAGKPTKQLQPQIINAQPTPWPVYPTFQFDTF